jgi:hypothetical protein
MIEVLIILAALLGIVYYVCQPFFGNPETASGPTLGARQVAERVIEESMANLQYDFHAGKISEEDYREMRADLDGRLAENRRKAEQVPASKPGKSKRRAGRSK